jgi:hypothetical protein
MTIIIKSVDDIMNVICDGSETISMTLVIEISLLPYRLFD